ncbi:hypothetical protein Tco_0018710 [Tanacetum coccineum]
MNYEEGLTDVAEMMKWFQSEWKKYLIQQLQSKIKESLTRFQLKVVKHITQARQEISLLFDKFYTSVEAAVINKKNHELQFRSSGTRPKMLGHHHPSVARWHICILGLNVQRVKQHPPRMSTKFAIGWFYTIRKIKYKFVIQELRSFKATDVSL